MFTKLTYTASPNQLTLAPRYFHTQLQDYIRFFTFHKSPESVTVLVRLRGLIRGKRPKKSTHN